MAASNGFRQVIHSIAQFLAEPAIPTRFNYRPSVEVAAVPTGLRPLDKALGLGGLPPGVMVELIESGHTPVSGGGAIIASRIAAKVQQQQEVVSVIDWHRGFDPWQAERCGLIAPHLLLTRPDTILAAVSSLESAARTAALVVVLLGRPPELLQHLEAPRRKTLLHRLHAIVTSARGVFLFVTTPTQKDPFDPANYPPGFPLAELAPVRLWLQNESWQYTDGVATGYKAGLAVIKNELASPGKGATLRVKLASP